ncbi:hypothetical protein ACFWRG_09710 [Micromonospora tulbaghiae]|uniref:hypothetical protein n=1 Tax=Micromonospora tulbaghiae TaxID=479978 RepID=UPI003668A0B2
MRIAEGNVVSFTPDHGGTLAVRFSANGETFKEPLIGWAVVVVHRERSDDGPEVVDTQLQPVVIDPADGLPATVTDYRANRTGHLRWEVIRS